MTKKELIQEKKVFSNKEHGTFYPLIKEAFRKAGVIFVILPNISGSKINGATKKVGNNIMLMVFPLNLSVENERK